MAKFPDLKDIRGLANHDLHGEIKKIRRQLFDLRCQAASEKLADSSLLGQGKKAIARIKTILRERELASAKGSTAT